MACEISTGDELLLTEMIFNGAFNGLTVEQTVALLSCFVFEEKVGSNARARARAGNDLLAPASSMANASGRVVADAPPPPAATCRPFPASCACVRTTRSPSSRRSWRPRCD